MNTCHALALQAQIDDLNLATDRVEVEPSPDWWTMIEKSCALYAELRHVEPSTVEGARIVAGAYTHWLEEAGRGDAAAGVREAVDGLPGALWPLLRVVTAVGGAAEAKGLVRYLRGAAVACGA